MLDWGRVAQRGCFGFAEGVNATDNPQQDIRQRLIKQTTNKQTFKSDTSVLLSFYI